MKYIVGNYLFDKYDRLAPTSRDSEITMPMEEDPLIHTINGNVSVSSLTYETKWSISDSLIHFAEIYRDAQGVIVRQDAHVCALQGPSIFSESSLTTEH